MNVADLLNESFDEFQPIARSHDLRTFALHSIIETLSRLPKAQTHSKFCHSRESGNLLFRDKNNRLANKSDVTKGFPLSRE
jgi:hypothetical protein